MEAERGIMETYIHRVQYYETDRMGITHHSNYIRWMEEARVVFLDSIGWGYDRMEELGILSPVVSVEANYRHTTTFGDRVAVQVWIQEYKGVRLVVSYDMKNINTGETVFTGSSSHCFLDREGTLIRMKKQFPELDEILRHMVGVKEI